MTDNNLVRSFVVTQFTHVSRRCHRHVASNLVNMIQSYKITEEHTLLYTVSSLQLMNQDILYAFLNLDSIYRFYFTCDQCRSRTVGTMPFDLDLHCHFFVRIMNLKVNSVDAD
jgi:hypothetical protein